MFPTVSFTCFCAWLAENLAVNFLKPAVHRKLVRLTGIGVNHRNRHFGGSIFENEAKPADIFCHGALAV